MAEYIDIYDRDGVNTGRRILRGEPMGPGEYARIVQVIVFNSRGEMLIQQRKKPYPSKWRDKWDVTVCGGLMAGENSRQAARRELSEELGIDHDFEDLMPHVTVFYGQGFSDVYLIEKDVEISELVLQKEEVWACRWADREEILRLNREGQFIPYYDSWLSYLCDVKGGYGNFADPGRDVNGKCADPIPLRPHHGMCMHYFVGKGYSPEFTEHMKRTLERFDREDPWIRIVLHTDTLCSHCPFHHEDLCETQEKVMRYDLGVLERTGIAPESVMRVSEYRRRVREAILDPGHRPEICGDCSWTELCYKTNSKGE